MATTDVKSRIATMFPAAQDIPTAADFAPNGGVYPDANLFLVDGQLRRWQGPTMDVLSPVCVRTDGKLERRLVGRASMVDANVAREALEAAKRTYERGRGPWPTMKVGERIERVLSFCQGMRAVREESVRLLMWEIGKTRQDSEREFDRTVQYVMDTVEALKEIERSASRFSQHGGILAQIRRSPLGVTLCMGPFNYPLNETFTTLIPALIMGNTIVAKLPRFGILCQLPLLKAFAECFPAGVVNIINGDGRTVVGPMMESGDVAVLAFIGSARVANILKKQHPLPNRLRCVLGLDAKNPAIILPDADLDLAVKECVTGALSFNGQRCTALKMIFVHRSVADKFVQRLSDAVDALSFGMPWEPDVKLTPLPEPDKAADMQRLVDDAVQKGARVTNKHGGLSNASFYFPAVVYPVKADMELYTREQFGPVVPVGVFDDVHQVFDYVVDSHYGQQVSVFGHDATDVGPLVDAMANQVCRVNLNAQCQRGPDVYPFTGRKDSAEGTLSVSDALRVFSIRSMVATPAAETNQRLLRDILTEHSSNFINTDYIF